MLLFSIIGPTPFRFLRTPLGGGRSVRRIFNLFSHFARRGLCDPLGRCLDHLSPIALVPGSSEILIALIILSGGVVEILVDNAGCGRDRTDLKRVLAHALKRAHEDFHVSDFTGH